MLECRQQIDAEEEEGQRGHSVGHQQTVLQKQGQHAAQREKGQEQWCIHSLDILAEVFIWSNVPQIKVKELHTKVAFAVVFSILYGNLQLELRYNRNIWKYIKGIISIPQLIDNTHI